MYASALGASATRAVGTTDGVLTAAEAVRLMAEQPVPIHGGEHLVKTTAA
jgi:hypothetical protein